MRKYKIYLLIIFSLLILDQTLKALAPLKPSFLVDEILSFSSLMNRGIAFGIGSDSSSPVMIILNYFLPIGAITWFGFQIFKKRNNPLLTNLSYSFFLGGALGNLVDRMRFGQVVDIFGLYSGKHHYLSFNFADLAITIGAVLIVLDSWKTLFQSKREVKL